MLVSKATYFDKQTECNKNNIFDLLRPSEACSFHHYPSVQERLRNLAGIGMNVLLSDRARQ